jgi:hypothetical protein
MGFLSPLAEREEYDLQKQFLMMEYRIRHFLSFAFIFLGSLLALPETAVQAQAVNQQKPTEAVPTITVDLSPLGKPDTITAKTVPARPAAVRGELAVEYRCSETNANANQVKAHLKVVNRGPSEIVLSELTIRYWFQSAGNDTFKWWCDWAQVGKDNVHCQFGRPAKARRSADAYLEISFDEAAGKIAPKADSGEVQIRYAKPDWGQMNQSNDYSFNAAQTDFAESTRVTLYRGGKLIWGAEPK